MKYRKKPVVIDAFQWDGTIDQLKREIPKDKWNKFIFTTFQWEYPLVLGNPLLDGNHTARSVDIKTLEGNLTASKNDFIIKGVRGEYYSCKPDIFEETYEQVKDGDLMPVKDVPNKFILDFILTDDYAVLASNVYKSDKDSANKIISKTKEYMQDQLEAYAYLKTLNEE